MEEVGYDCVAYGKCVNFHEQVMHPGSRIFTINWLQKKKKENSE